MSVFKAYDVRGVYPSEINENLFRRVGRAAAATLNAKTVVIGRDMRASGIPLAAAMIQGLSEAGCHVVDVGMVSTPMLYFATVLLKADAGVQVTASHNPAQYNGCKWCRADAVPMAYDSGLADIERLVGKDSLPPPPATPGKVEKRDVGTDYRANLLKYADGLKPYAVAVDAGNGVMGAFLPALFERLPCELLPLYFDPDGTFPNHEANPLKPENMADLREKVAGSNADLGVAFDGDGDRAMFTDENGEIIPADFVTALFAMEMLEREPGAVILYDLRSSRVVAREIEARGGVGGMTRVGHSFIKARMRECKAIFAGELSGHFYFRDLHYTDNAEMAMLTMLALMSKSGKKLSELVAPLKRFHASGERNYVVDDAAAALARVEDAFAPEVDEVKKLDGLSLIAPTWWANIRSSNTEPVVRLNLEGESERERDALLERIEQLIGGKPAAGH